MILLTAPLLLALTFEMPDAATTATQASNENVLVQFKARKRPYGFLVLPIEVSGRRLMAAVNTGSAYTMFDASLRTLLGKPLSESDGISPAGKVRSPMFESPEIKIGPLPPLALKEGVPTVDFISRRRPDQDAFEVMLGMDVLRNLVVRIDCDRGEVAFLKSAMPTVPKPVPIKEIGGTPWMLGMLGNQRHGAWFQLNTGCVCGKGGTIDGTLSEQDANLLSTMGLLSIDHPDAANRSDGARAAAPGRRRQRLRTPLFVNGRGFVYMLDPPTFADAEYCSLGLRFLGRFITIFDFPNRVVYFDPPAPRDVPLGPLRDE